jgi:hypothetical protein
MNDLDTVANELRQFFQTVLTPSDQIWSQSPAAKVIDCVLSLNRRYDKVVSPRVEQFVRNHPDIEQWAQLRTLIKTYESPANCSKAELRYNDQRRSETLVGVIDYFLQEQQNHEGETEAAGGGDCPTPVAVDFAASSAP